MPSHYRKTARRTRGAGHGARGCGACGGRRIQKGGKKKGFLGKLGIKKLPSMKKVIKGAKTILNTTAAVAGKAQEMGIGGKYAGALESSAKSLKKNMKKGQALVKAGSEVATKGEGKHGRGRRR